VRSQSRTKSHDSGVEALSHRRWRVDSSSLLVESEAEDASEGPPV
jgi:hypothetical protein